MIDDEKIISTIRGTFAKKLLREPEPKALNWFFYEIKSGRIKLEELEKKVESTPEFKKLENLRKGYTTTNEGFVIHLDTEDWIISRTLALNSTWEPKETEFLKKIITGNMKVLDIGANLGYFTILFSRQVGSEGKVIAFEPNPFSFDLLKKNIKANNLQNVYAIQKAVSNISGYEKLYLSKKNHGDNRLFSVPILNSDLDRDIAQVEVTTLDDYLKDIHIDFLKMDVQGSEPKVIEGGYNLIKNSRNLKMMVEFWPLALKVQGYEPINFLLQLESLDFDIYDLSDDESQRISSYNELCSKYQGNLYTNLYCVRN
ncbi:MAG TPA: FkbM family methyltransferase [Nitrosopumilaceae archaeon]|nr:FkbM family methyltransferase [Nitrosopumilaceae archaeon]